LWVRRRRKFAFRGEIEKVIGWRRLEASGKKLQLREMEEVFREELMAVMEGSGECLRLSPSISYPAVTPSASRKPHQSPHKSPIAFHQTFIDTHLMKP
jgi:hypothetical protein